MPFDLPTSRDENWKYANLRPLAKAQFAAVAQAAAVEAGDLPAEIQGYARYTFVDGLFVPALSAARTPPHISVTPANAAMEANESSDLRFASLNAAHARNIAHIAVDGTACIELLFVATADAQTASSHPRIELRAAPSAQLSLIERHVSLADAPSFINCAADLDIGAGARLDHYRVQQSAPRATWFDTLQADLAAGANYQLHLIQLGALSARSTMHIALRGERAELGIYSVSVASGQQVHDAFACVEHVDANALSRQSFRGVAADRSRSAFNSKVVVREGARGTDSYQNLRGLLAGTGAEIDVRPQLEIYTDDVRCAHGATAGKLDENMLFYLLSRGLERETAERLLKWAFLEDVVAKIAVPQLRQEIEQSLAGQFL